MFDILSVQDVLACTGFVLCFAAGSISGLLS